VVTLIMPRLVLNEADRNMTRVITRYIGAVASPGFGARGAQVEAPKAPKGVRVTRGCPSPHSGWGQKFFGIFISKW